MRFPFSPTRRGTSSWADDRVVQALPKQGVIIVVTDDGESVEADVARIRAQRPSARIEVIELAPAGAGASDAATAETVADLHERMRRIPNIDLFVDAVGADDVKAQLFRQCLYYVQDGGAYISVQGAGDAGWALIERVRRMRGASGIRREPEASSLKVGLIAEKEPEGPVAEQRLAAATGRTRNEQHHVVVQKVGTHLLKLREASLTQAVIDERGLDWARERIVTPGFTYPSQATLHLNPERFRYRFADTFTAPDMKIREYDDVICQRREIVYRGDVVLPDTFRLTGQRYLRNGELQDVDEHFARPARQGRPGVLRGEYYHLDTEYPNVYGHLVTDMVGRLWGWHELKAEHPRLKVLISDRAKTHDLPSWLRVTLNAYGIRDEDMAMLHGPMRVEKLFAVTPLLVNYDKGYAHPRIRDTWQLLGDSLRAGSTLTDTPRKLFISRPADNNRLCRNRDELEQYFSDRGFSVIRPESYSMPDQAAIFSGADAIAGYGGSGMLTSIYATGPKKKLVINPWSHHPINEYLISTVYGDEITYLYQKPEITKKTPEFPKGPFHSPYTFDFDLGAGREMLERFME